MSSHECPHVAVPDNCSVVDADDLQSNSRDIFKMVAQVDKWRCSRDMIYRMLTMEDEKELIEHVLGIIALPGTTLKESLMQQQYSNHLSPKAWSVFRKVQNYHVENKNTCNVTRRTQLHFLLFVTLAMENEFCQYMVVHCHERDKLRYFINKTVQPALSALLQGELLSFGDKKKSSATFGVAEFVNKCTLSYMSSCLPMPLT